MKREMRYYGFVERQTTDLIQRTDILKIRIVMKYIHYTRYIPNADRGTNDSSTFV